MTSRALRSVHRAYQDDLADLTTRRPLPGPSLPQIDPFLFLNHHGPQSYPPGNNGLPFGPHPHRGFETVTFMVEGSLAHQDSSGAQSVVADGGVQWMTAGSGIVHSELSPDSFKRDGGPLEILQLWVNLPARLKFTDPDYIEVPAAKIPSLSLADGVELRPVSGFEDAPVSSLTGVALATVHMQPGSSASLPAPAGRNILFYTVQGSVRIGNDSVPEHCLARFDDGDEIEVTAPDGALILFGHADPIGEPVVAHGPFVMNSQEEIRDAFEAYRRGEFA
ncbi:MAG: nuclease PIN [Altererythrobacter sp.]|nr:nuclease PIN [Altererythrobacter sp.]